MKRYTIEVELKETYEIEAESEEEAFLQASQDAIEGGCWGYEILKEEELNEKDN